MNWTLLILICQVGEPTCDWQRMQYPTEQACAVRAKPLGDKVADLNPNAKVYYTCHEEPTA